MPLIPVFVYVYVISHLSVYRVPNKAIHLENWFYGEKTIIFRQVKGVKLPARAIHAKDRVI